MKRLQDGKDCPFGRLLSIPEGELVLLRTKQGPFTLGVLSVADISRVYFQKPSYCLQPFVNLEGVSRAQVTIHSAGYFCSNRVVELYSGKEDIVAYLEQHTFKDHAIWIKNLRKPYHLPSIQTVHVLNVASS